MIDIVSEVLHTMNAQMNRIEKCLNLLTYDQIWTRLQSNMNSIGNLCIHLVGNEYQHFVSGIGEKPLIRERSLEFTMQGGYKKEELIKILRSVRDEATSILEQVTEDDLHKDITVNYSLEDWNTMKNRNEDEKEPFYRKRLLTLLFQVSEHYGYHAGQIVVFTKLLQPSDESFTGYRH